MPISIKNLNALIQIHKNNLDLQKSNLSNLVQSLKKLQNNLLEIDKNIKKEQSFVTETTDSSLALMQILLNNFLTQELKKQQTIITQILKLHEEITQLQEIIILKNQEIKKYEIIKEKEIIKFKKSQELKEEKSLEEILLNQKMSN